MRYFIVVLFTALVFGCSLFLSNDEQEIVNGFKVVTIEEIKMICGKLGYIIKPLKSLG